ncbi:MAG TPA: SusC/RagA family TonB-linked outer membrane protein, partial [Chitinophagaceae bacterium]|nr:SusC/RagA family TonB-linked outer membrane protein [Chitinophagaceae bacterium]
MFCRNLLKATVLFTLLLITQLSNAQDKVITGKVTDSRNASGVAGVNITPKGGTGGTQTGSDGSYRISVNSSITVLVFSSAGFTTLEVSIDGRSVIDVTLEINTSTLGDVVVIGYGTARKRDLTGSITSVSSKDFVKGPISTPEQLIMGKVPGVQITPNSGMPGSGSRIRIRAGTSLRASNDPLIVIDGVPLDNGGISGASNPLALINPNDIENMTILKDASAAAIYGNRAANGVILITTKKGTAGRLQVDFSTLNSISAITDKVDVLNPEEFRSLVTQNGNASEVAMLGNENTVWQDLIYHKAFATDNNISVRGGVNQLPYRLSLGYLNQDGILKRSNLQRYSAGLNLSPKFLDNHLGVNLNVKYSHSKNFFANGAALGSAVYFDPTKPVMSGKQEYGGYYEWLSSGTTLNGLSQKNPVGLLNQREDESNVDRVIGNVQIDYKFHFLPELRANLNVGGDRSHGEGTIFVPATAAADFSRTSVTGAPAPGRFDQYEQTKTNKL